MVRARTAGSATAVLHVAFSMVPSEEHRFYDDDGLRATEADRARGFTAAAAWLTHRAELGDPLARQVRETLDDGEPDGATRWELAMRSVLVDASPPRVVFTLGPAELGPGDVDAVLEVLRERGEPAIRGVGRCEPAEVAAELEPDAAPRRLVLESGDGAVTVVLDWRCSHVIGPLPAAARIREIVDARRVPPRRFAANWVRAVRPGAIAILMTLAGGGLGVADGEFDPRGVLVLLAVVALAVLHVLYRVVVLLCREASPGGGGSAPEPGRGWIRIGGATRR